MSVSWHGYNCQALLGASLSGQKRPALLAVEMFRYLRLPRRPLANGQLRLATLGERYHEHRKSSAEKPAHGRNGLFVSRFCFDHLVFLCSINDSASSATVLGS